MADPDGFGHAGLDMRADTSTRVVAIRGELTAASGQGLLDAVRCGAHEDVRRIVVDITHVTRIDRGGTTALLDAYVAVSLRRGSLALAGVTPECRETLMCAGVLDVIELIEVIGFNGRGGSAVSSAAPRKESS